MAGASGATRLVSVINANWQASPGGAQSVDFAFNFMVVTDDGERHVIEAAAAAANALIALCASPAKLLWGPQARTLIAAGVRGTWLDWLSRSAIVSVPLTG